MMGSVIKTYYLLTKPGIIRGNAITVAAGFLLASSAAGGKGHINFWLLLATLAGISLVIASGCVFNNIFDRGIDEKMERTKNRALVKGIISVRNAIIYGIILGLLGFLVLAFYTNLLTVFLALLGLFFYVVMYSLWKRRTTHGVLVGSISGAVPPVVGYCAVSNNFDAGAIILFMMLVFWQMPHFYAIAIYRLKEYAAAGIPVLPIKRGIYITKVQMLLYIHFFIVAALMLTVFGYTGYLYLTVAVLLGFAWLGFAIKGFWIKTNDQSAFAEASAPVLRSSSATEDGDRLWARKMFVFSLVVLMSLCLMIAVDAVVL